VLDREPPLAPRSRSGAHRAGPDLIGDSEPMVTLKNQIARVGRSDAKVLVTGESGTGKELVAQAIHATSHRSANAYVAVNCAGLPESLLESELFGHVRGSFTGAYRDKPGKLETADRGTIFLDEVGEMTLRMQGLLLRVLETGEIQKVGSDHTGRTVDVRVIAATNRHLPQLVAQGRFREDLYYRLRVIQLELPALRDRGADIRLLMKHFVNEFSSSPDCVVRGFTPEAEAAMCRYGWPGNVRELENVIERLTITCPHADIRLEDLPREVIGKNGGGARQFERRRTVADELFEKMTREGQSFWTAVYPPYMQRDLTRADVRALVQRGLAESHGSYRALTRVFNMEPDDYKRFLNFLRKQNCQLPFRKYR
jgi:transcriptional regulator with PAS, ATPase and Fis domain